MIDTPAFSAIVVSTKMFRAGAFIVIPSGLRIIVLAPTVTDHLSVALMSTVPV